VTDLARVFALAFSLKMSDNIDMNRKEKKYAMLKRIMTQHELFEHNVHLPEPLVAEMLNEFAMSLKKDAKILILYNLEIVVSLMEDYNFIDPKNITLYHPGNKSVDMVAEHWGINIVYELEENMKFNIGLGNPPYSADKGNKLLYPEFFQMCLERCDKFAMVMPVNLDSKTNKLKKHNHLVRKHSYFQSEDVSDHFNVSVGTIAYICASSEVTNEVAEEEVQQLPTILPNRERIKPINGVGGLTPVANGGGRCIDKIHKTGIVENKVALTDVEKFARKFWKQGDVNKKWLVLINHTPSRGKFNAEIVKYDKRLVWGRWVFAIQASSKKEAKEVVKHLHSDTIVNYLLDNMTSHTVSKTMLESLPGLV
jgi:hypothetical protein